MAARQTFVGVSAEYLETIIVQRCEFVEAAMGSAIPVDAGGVDTHSAADEAGSLGQRGVEPASAMAAPTRHQPRPPPADVPQEALAAGRSMTSGQITDSRLTPVGGVGQMTIIGMIARRIQTEANSHPRA